MGATWNGQELTQGVTLLKCIHFIHFTRWEPYSCTSKIGPLVLYIHLSKIDWLYSYEDREDAHSTVIVGLNSLDMNNLWVIKRNIFIPLFPYSIWNFKCGWNVLYWNHCLWISTHMKAIRFVHVLWHLYDLWILYIFVHILNLILIRVCYCYL